MKRCPEITIKQFVYFKIHLGQLFKPRVEFPVKLEFYLCVQMPVFGVEISYYHFCVQNTQNVYK